MTAPRGPAGRRALRAPTLPAALALSVASLAILCAAPAQYLGRQHDDILFVIAAHAMSFGRYVLFTAPGSPPLTHVSPGLPFLLQPVVWLAGEWMPAYQAFCALALAAVPWILWAWLERRSGPTVSVLVPLLFATSPLVLSQSGCVMPEGIYALLAAGLLLALELPAKESAGWAGGLLLALTQVRPAWLSLLPAALAQAVGERRFKDAARTAAPAAAGLLAWSLWTYLQSGAGTQEALELSNAYQGQGPGHLAGVAWDNLGYYLAALGGCGLPARLGGTPAAWALGAVLAALSLAGAVQILRKDPWDPAVLMLAFGLLMHAVWPWQYERYLIPLLPWLLWTAAHALGRKSAAVLGLLLAGQVLFHAPRWLGKSPWAEPELRQTYAWLRERTGPADILASPLYARDGFYAVRPAAPLPDSPEPAEAAGRLKKQRVRFVLWQEGLDLGITLGADSPLGRAFERTGRNLQDGRFFRLVYSNPIEGARVYEVR